MSACASTQPIRSLILDLHRQGLSLAAIARRTGMDRSTVAKYVKRGLEPPCYGPRHPRPTVITPVEDYLRERLAAFPELNGSRLFREIQERGYTGSYTALKGFLRTIRPAAPPPFERRFETAPGQQAQVDFAHFRTTFTYGATITVRTSVNQDENRMPAP
jgi:transposase